MGEAQERAKRRLEQQRAKRQLDALEVSRRFTTNGIAPDSMAMAGKIVDLEQRLDSAWRCRVCSASGRTGSTGEDPQSRKLPRGRMKYDVEVILQDINTLLDANGCEGKAGSPHEIEEAILDRMLASFKFRDERIAALEDELADWRESAKKASGEGCGDELHCTCVGPLRQRIADLEADLRKARSWISGELSKPPKDREYCAGCSLLRAAEPDRWRAMDD